MAPADLSEHMSFEIEKEREKSPLPNSSIGDDLPVHEIMSAVSRFIDWLNIYGEESYDFQTYYSGAIGRRAKQLYYTHRRLGTLAVLPIVFSEAFVPSARKLFW